MKNIVFGIVCGLMMSGVPVLSIAEERVVRDRQSEIQNEELRRSVAADRQAAKQAHEQKMAKQREADTQRLKSIDGSKTRYKDVITERQADEKRTEREKEQAREQKRAEKSHKDEKQKIK